MVLWSCMLRESVNGRLQVTMMNVGANNSTNNSTSFSRKYIYLPFNGRVKTAMFIAMGVLCVYGTAANSLVFYLKKKKNDERRNPRKPFYRNLLAVFIQNLSVCHILFCSIAFPAQVMLNFIDVTSSNWLCKLWWFLRLLFPIMTLNHLLVLAIEIYLSIVYPLVVPSARFAKRLAVATWVAGGLVVLMPSATFTWKLQTTGPHSYTQMCLIDKTVFIYKLIVLVFVVINIILPTLVLIFLTYRIFTFLQRKNASRVLNPHSQRKVTCNRNARAIVNLLFIFFLPYGLFLFVSITRSTLKTVQEDFAMQYLLLLVTSVLAYSNAAICPTILLIRQPDLQQSFKYNIKSKFISRKDRVKVTPKSSAVIEVNVQAIRNMLAVSGLQERLEKAEMSIFKDMRDTRANKRRQDCMDGLDTKI